MRAVIQRVKYAKVIINNEEVSKINSGLVVFVGIAEDDTPEDIDYLANKIVNLRIFEDDEGKMNLSSLALNKEILIISQFTLYGDCRKGNRPSFTKAKQPPAAAEELYNQFINKISSYGIKVATGKFGHKMGIVLENDGPVTLLVDSKKLF